MIRSCQQLAPPCALAVRCMSSLHSLLGAAAFDNSSSSSSSGISIPERQLPPAAGGGAGVQEQQPGIELPSLCGEPKNKLSIHRRGNRRISYYAQRKELFAQCKHCGQTGTPHQFFATNKQCTGQCLAPPTKSYPQEYKPPC